MEIKVYLHRTKKQNFAVADCFSVFINFDEIPENKRNDVDYINLALKNDIQRIARTRDCVKKYGTAYISFLRPQYEGPDKENGNGKVYFDNTETIFLPIEKKPKKPKHDIVKAVDKGGTNGKE